MWNYVEILHKKGQVFLRVLCVFPIGECIFRLVKEVVDMQDSIEYLHRKLQEAEAQHQQLLKTRSSLESDLHSKVNSLFIDREKCMGMRRSFPITATIK
jgi:tektin-3